MTLDASLEMAVASIPECVAAGYVDLASNQLVGIKTVDSHPEEIIELLAMATKDLFQGPNVQAIENIFRTARGRPDEERQYFQEIIINSDHLLHVFLRGQDQAKVAAFVCRKGANLGMVLTKSRMAMLAIESAQ